MSGTSYLTTASCIVFVGNIPYGLSETQITDIFSNVGRVVCFRMVFDRETGRSKGYGFAEYIDAETAASAVRNLDNYEVMGRKLRVDYSSQGYVGKEGYPGKEGYATKEAHMGKGANYPDVEVIYSEAAGYTTVNGNDRGRYGIPKVATIAASTVAGSEGSLKSRYGVPITPAGPASGVTEAIVAPNATGTTNLLPKLPQGVEVHPNLNTPDSISQTLAAIPIPQLLRALIEMKELATTDPLKASELLRQCPQLAYAIFQALIMMNLVEPGVLAQLLDPNNTANMYNQAHNAFMATHLTQGTPHKPSPMIPMAVHIPSTAQPNYFAFPMQQQEAFATQIPLQQQQRRQGIQEPDKAMLLQRVMVLTSEEIARLPKEQQQQVLMLKHRLVTEGF